MNVNQDEKIVSESPTPSTTSPQVNKTVTRRLELWSYYIYYIGNNGLSGFNFGPSQFQNLLFLAGYDPSYSAFTVPCTTAQCVLPFIGQVRDVNAIVLLTNAISFVIQAVLLLVIGAWADYGRWRPYITIFFTVFSVCVAFGWLGVQDPSKWSQGLILYVMGLIGYQLCFTFWSAAFPGLARDLLEVQESLRQVDDGDKDEEAHARFVSLQRNRISNMSFTICSAGEILILAVMVGILKALKSDDSTENNTHAFSVIITYTGGVWLLCALPWFTWEQYRPGLDPPPGTNLMTVGVKQLYVAFRECLKLKQTFLYLIYYFMMGETLNTTVTVVGTLQNSLVSYSTLDLTYLLLVGIATQCLGIYAFWFVQKRFKISTRVMLLFNSFWIILLTVWGLIGIQSSNFGFKNVWEVWAYQAYYGLLVCPAYAYFQTMISEVSPLPQMFLFFSLFSVIGKTSTFVGPLISSAIITASNHNNNMPFVFLFVMGTVSLVPLWMIDTEKSRIECAKFIDAEQNRDAFALPFTESPSNAPIVDENVSGKVDKHK